MKAHNGREIPYHEEFFCICHALRSRSFCGCACHDPETAVSGREDA